EWLNSGPLTLPALRGKVVLVWVWTFACVNCQNVRPRVKPVRTHRVSDRGAARRSDLDRSANARSHGHEPCWITSRATHRCRVCVHRTTARSRARSRVQLGDDRVVRARAEGSAAVPFGYGR